VKLNESVNATRDRVDNMEALLSGHVENQQKLAEEVMHLETHLDNKIVEVMDTAVTGLKENFLQLFAESNNASNRKAQELDQRLTRSQAEQARVVERLSKLEESNASHRKDMFEFKVQQQNSMEEVIKSTNQMSSDVERAVTAATAPMPPAQRFTIAISVWICILM
jgi:hypothetical protein